MRFIRVSSMKMAWIVLSVVCTLSVSASNGDTVTSIDVHYEIIHPNVGDLYVKLTNEDKTDEHIL